MQGLSRLQAIAGIVNKLTFNAQLTILSVLALLAEHSFWFSGDNMEKQFSHAINSFKSQKHINISTVMANVEIAFKNASHKKDPAWLNQWVIDNKLVCDIVLNFQFKTLTY